MRLYEAFEVVRGDVVAFIGAGGKTSALVGLGYELQEMGWRVLAATTTQIDEDRLSLMPAAMSHRSGAATISQALSEHGFVFLHGDRRGTVYRGLTPVYMRQLLDTVDSDVLLLEADYADQLPLKAHRVDEPAIPAETSLVVPMASVSVLDRPLDDANVYNPQAMIDKFGFYAGSNVRAPWVAQVLRDDELGLRGIPKRARVIGFLNQTPENGYARSRARLIARLSLRSPRLNGVAVGSVRAADPIFEVQRPIGAIVLAGGMSTRMGQPKVLLPWSNGKTIIEHIIEQLIRSRVDQIVVVTGPTHDEVKALLKPMGVKVSYNRSYRTGEMLSSLKTGLRAMPDHIAATMIVLGDQPRLQPKVIYKVMKAYAEGEGHLIAPSFQMRRGHPILVSRRYWPEFFNLPRTGSPRDVINAHQDEIHYINVETDSVLRDVDTPDDYDQERKRAGLTRKDIRRERPDAS